MISPYLVILLFLIFFTFLSECSKDIEKISFSLIFVFLTLFLAFRYGQGTDFFGYNYLFNCIDNVHDAIFNPQKIHSEIGMRLLYAFFDNYIFFNMFVSVFVMTMLFRLLNKCSFNRCFALLIFFPTCYLTYYFSAIRQAMALSIFLGIMLECLIRNKNKQYFVWNIIACCFHISAVILFILPFLKKNDFIYSKKIIIGSIIGGIFFFIICYFNLIPLFGRWKFTISGIALLSYVERLISLCMVLKLAQIHNAKEKDELSMVLLNTYILGTCLYFNFWCLQSISRLSIYFKGLECILIPYYLWKSVSKNYLYASIFSLIAIVMTVKNIDSYINQGLYYPDVSMLNYPYVSIFDSSDKIFDYRPRNSFKIINLL